MIKKIKAFFKKQNTSSDLNEKIAMLETRIQQIEDINTGILQEVLSALKARQQVKIVKGDKKKTEEKSFH